ncbi:hypothetical protein [Chondrinema litorale]|uniref:hypothetical protein n=1 Tax=Chondrinema litorale TaxID=2994555 RepID=UPI0025432B09|nr:hypothetical protein [Chondrinema litorale]UZR92717.1 hypothetical protein OQ292_12700 [Chondrinema litorale]
MTTFVKDLETFSDLEKTYQQKYPNAQQVGNFYHYFGIDKMIDIMNEAEGREILFFVEPSSNQCIYSFQ